MFKINAYFFFLQCFLFFTVGMFNVYDHCFLLYCWYAKLLRVVLSILQSVFSILQWVSLILAVGALYYTVCMVTHTRCFLFYNWYVRRLQSVSYIYNVEC